MDGWTTLDLLRLVVGGCGFLLALFLLRIAWIGRHERARMLGLLSHAALLFLVAAGVLEHVHDDTFTWRTPLAFAAFAMTTAYVLASMKVDWRPPAYRTR
jgi:hypothetical protein